MGHGRAVYFWNEMSKLGEKDEVGGLDKVWEDRGVSSKLGRLIGRQDRLQIHLVLKEQIVIPRSLCPTLRPSAALQTQGFQGAKGWATRGYLISGMGMCWKIGQLTGNPRLASNGGMFCRMTSFTECLDTSFTLFARVLKQEIVIPGDCVPPFARSKCGPSRKWGERVGHPREDRGLVPN
jgi:hypothetical protein